MSLWFNDRLGLRSNPTVEPVSQFYLILTATGEKHMRYRSLTNLTYHSGKAYGVKCQNYSQPIALVRARGNGGRPARACSFVGKEDFV